jgi:glycosyltransferase involved in cell wall biosynthesis
MLVASRYMKDLLAFNGIPESKISVLPLFTRLPPMEDIESDSSENIVLFVGLIHPVKGADKLIKALALVKSEFRAHLIGEGPNLEQYRRLAADEGIGDRINFARWVEHDKISQYYAEASVVAVPSWWTEAFGIVGIEAMAHATPVVAFETGGISDWLDDGVTGFLVQRGDIDTLAAKIDALLSDKALASEMGQNAREAAEKKFNREDYLPKLIGVYERVLSSWKSS